MKDEPTPEMIAMAREMADYLRALAASHLKGPNNG